MGEESGSIKQELVVESVGVSDLTPPPISSGGGIP
jgi:hypothetical protein